MGFPAPFKINSMIKRSISFYRWKLTRLSVNDFIPIIIINRGSQGPFKYFSNYTIRLFRYAITLFINKYDTAEELKYRHQTTSAEKHLYL